MAVVIRLQRVGKKNRPSYRLAVQDRRFKRDGRFIEIVGNYDPLKKDEVNVVIRHDRIQHWVSKGAQLSDRIRTFLDRFPAPAAAASSAAPAPAAKPVAAPKAEKPAPAPKAEKPAAPKAEKAEKKPAKPAAKKPAK